MLRSIRGSRELARIRELEIDRNIVGLIAELHNDASYGRHTVIRSHAADALGRLGDRRAVPHLAELAQDPDVSARHSALSALRKLRARDAEPVFLAGLTDPAPIVRMTAAKALGLLGNRVVIPQLRRTLDADPDAEVRLAAAGALVELDDDAVLGRLGQALRDVSWRVRGHRDWERVRRLADAYSK